MDDQSVPATSGHAAAPELPRPAPSSPLSDRLRAWIDWVGVGRLVAAAVATAIVCAGGYWLIRTPPPPTEAALPRVSSSSGPTGPTTGAADDLQGGPGAAPDTPAAVIVHVAGAVVAPGVYTLPVGARVHQAVGAAGGVTADAEPNALNLAGEVVDGTRVYVPSVGEPAPVQPMEEVESGPIDVNRATADELDELPGVGPATATAIVTERERNGPFSAVEDLERVPGIGPAKLDALRELVTT